MTSSTLLPEQMHTVNLEKCKRVSIALQWPGNLVREAGVPGAV